MTKVDRKLYNETELSKQSLKNLQIFGFKTNINKLTHPPPKILFLFFIKIISHLGANYELIFREI